MEWLKTEISNKNLRLTLKKELRIKYRAKNPVKRIGHKDHVLRAKSPIPSQFFFQQNHADLR